MAGGLARGKDLCGFRPKEEKFLCNGVDKDVTILSERDFDGSNVFRKKRPGIFIFCQIHAVFRQRFRVMIAFERDKP